jgi:hypothetical protein
MFRSSHARRCLGPALAGAGMLMSYALPPVQAVFRRLGWQFT